VNVSSTTASLTLTDGGTDFGGDPHLRAAYSPETTGGFFNDQGPVPW
jgi:hypothetical protein